jgi:hypothetical protein
VSSLALSNEEMQALYLLLSLHGTPELQKTQKTLQRQLYQDLSIGEMENLTRLIDQGRKKS